VFLIYDFSKEQADLRIETCLSNFKCFSVKEIFIGALVGIIKVVVRSARCNNKEYYAVLYCNIPFCKLVGSPRVSIFVTHF